ncbi:MAG TPA: hypothetical protein DDW52_03545, partial [Planctomycetaceae bacterium]|nr:hypothetical protein [Planctomycetaceae bacterium]
MHNFRSRNFPALSLLMLSSLASVGYAQDSLPLNGQPNRSGADNFLSSTDSNEQSTASDLGSINRVTNSNSLGNSANALDLTDATTDKLGDSLAIGNQPEDKPASSSLQIAPIDVAFPNTEIRGMYQVRKRELPDSPPVLRTVELAIPLDTDMQEFVKRDLPSEAIRTFVSTVAAQRHPILLQKLRAAKESGEQEKILDAMRSNYEMHYAVECWWRRKKLEELEAQVARLRSQLEQRVDNQAAYVKAAMTIADLYADGVSAP